LLAVGKPKESLDEFELIASAVPKASIPMIPQLWRGLLQLRVDAELAKPEAERGLDEVAERDGRPVAKGPHYCADPLGNRTGAAPPPALAEVLNKTAADGAEAADRARAARGVALTARGLQEKVDNVRGAVAMAWPMALPAWDPVRLMLEDACAPDGFLAECTGRDFLDPATATLWWAGKEFFRDTTVGDRVGRNEKTKVVARLQSATGGAPVREPAVSEDERKELDS
jgi:hypothetical protein